MNLEINPGTSESVFRDLSQWITHAAVMALPHYDLPDRFSVDIIRKEPLVLLSRQDAGKTRRERLEKNPYIRFDSKSWAETGAAKFLQDEGIQIEPCYDIDALEPIGKLVQEGMGVSLVPYWAGLDLDAANLKVDVIRNERYCRKIALVTPKDTTRPHAVQALKAALLSDSLV
ncbi:MAG: LysR substrate-binding domain-containing protein [Verrucomicrobia bacterium]|nr:LysR substrate-binding domain-containing protein [Verrucomicrobiota bacterium]